MKIISFRYPRNFITDLLLSLLCVFVITLILQNGESAMSVFSCDSAEDRVGFFYKYNWNIDPDSEIHSDVMIPEIFDETYRQYNQLQLEQGFDLTPYAGRRVSKFSYRFRSFGDLSKPDSINATLYVCDGKIIAADIYDSSINGFIQGVVFNE